MRSTTWMVLVAGMAFSGSAFAKDVVVPPLLSKGVDPLVVLNLTSLVASELDFQGGFDNVSQLDKTPAGMNSACVTNPSCLKGVASGNKANVVIGGTVALVSSKYEFNLFYYDADANKIVRTKTFVLPNVPSVIADSMGGYIKELTTGKSQAAAAAETSMGNMDTVSAVDLLQDEEDDSDSFGSGVAPSRQVEPERDLGGLDSLPEEEDEEEIAAAAAAKAKADAAAAKAKADAEAKARADAAAAKAKADAEAKARAEAAARAKAAPVDEDEIEFGRPAEGDIQMEEISFSSAAGLIQMDGGDEEEVAEEAEEAPVVAEESSRSRAPSLSDDSAATRRPSSSRPSLGSSSSSSSDEEEYEETPRRTTSSRTVASDEDEYEEPRASTSRSSTSSSSRSSTSRSSSSSRDEDEDTARSGRSRLDEEEEDYSPSKRYEEEDLDLDRRSETSRSGSKGKADDSKVGLAARVGYAGFQGLSFITYGAELAYSLSPRFALNFGLDAHSVKRTVPQVLQEEGYPATAWNTIVPLHAGGLFRLGDGGVVPYLGADVAIIPAAIKGALQGSGVEDPGTSSAFGGRARLGVDLRLSDNFGLNLDGSAGVWKADTFATVEKDMKTSGFVPTVSVGTVLRF